MRLKKSIFIFMVFLIFASCAPQPGALPNTGNGQTPQAEMDLANTKWRLVSFGEPGQETPVIASSTITLEFSREGKASGSGGCNSYSTTFVAQGNTLSFGEITRTLMTCERGRINRQEQQYFQALKTASRFNLAGDRLAIWYADEQGVLNWVKFSGNPATTPTPRATLVPTNTPTPTASQPTLVPRRIHFETGATSATLVGDLQASGSDQYVLRALKGQMMRVDLSFTEGEAILVIWGADGQVLLSDHAEASNFKGVLPATQDYYIHVKGRPEGETVYHMEITIPP